MSATIPASQVITGEIPVSTGGELDVVDITAEVRLLVNESGVENGVVNIFVAGATAGLTTIEFEPGAVADLKDAFERMAPREMDYAHNARWGDGNGHSHVRAAMLGPDITVPIRHGDPLLGTWQQIILVEFDTRSRNRIISLTITGGSAPKEAKVENNRD